MMFPLKIVYYLHILPLAVHLNVLGWTSRGDHSKPFLLIDFFCGSSHSCLKIVGCGWPSEFQCQSLSPWYKMGFRSYQDLVGVGPRGFGTKGFGTGLDKSHCKFVELKNEKHELSCLLQLVPHIVKRRHFHRTYFNDALLLLLLRFLAFSDCGKIQTFSNKNLTFIFRLYAKEITKCSK